MICIFLVTNHSLYLIEGVKLARNLKTLIASHSAFFFFFFFWRMFFGLFFSNILSKGSSQSFLVRRKVCSSMMVCLSSEK